MKSGITAAYCPRSATSHVRRSPFVLCLFRIYFRQFLSSSILTLAFSPMFYRASHVSDCRTTRRCIGRLCAANCYGKEYTLFSDFFVIFIVTCIFLSMLFHRSTVQRIKMSIYRLSIVCNYKVIYNYKVVCLTRLDFGRYFDIFRHSDSGFSTIDQATSVPYNIIF